MIMKQVMMDKNEVGVAEAKKHFSELLERVAYAGERIVISKRGRPVAVLIPPVEPATERSLDRIEGWLEEDDPFFEAVDQIVRNRSRHSPRAGKVARKRMKSAG